MGERIGTVKTGLSEEKIATLMKTKTFSPGATVINLEEAAPEEHESNSCIICQVYDLIPAASFIQYFSNLIPY